MEIADTINSIQGDILPDDWQLVSIGEISQIYGRIGFRGYTINDIVKEGQGAITISPSNMFDGKIKFEKNTYISWFKYEESPEIKIYNGDVLIVKTGSTFGKTALVVNLKVKATLNPQVVVLKKITINNVYLSYVISFKHVQKQISASIVGGAIPTLSQKQVMGYKIPNPPLLEQTAIATALSDIDELITQTEKLIEKKKAIKQGVMQELLKPKEGWEKVTLGNVINVSRGGSPRPIQSYLTSDPNGINWIKIGDTDVESKYIQSANEKITSDGAISSRKVYAGDFILSNSMSFGRPYILNIDGCIHDGWLVLQNYQHHFDRDFLYYSLMSSYVLDQYLRLAAGSSVLNLNKEIVKGVTLLKPKDINEQRSIANILASIDEDLDLQIKKLTKLKLQKQGMMQALLTGKIRLI